MSQQFKIDIPLQASRDIISSRINALRDSHLSAGVVFNGAVYDCDDLSILRLTATRLVSSTKSELIVVRTKDNVDNAFTYADFIALYEKLVTYANDVRKHAWKLKNDVSRSKRPAEVVIKSGWPNNA